ncbi:ABC-three component system protein [Achromobacter ruhlandii]|uniref:ABC-three component system protein n=1 Tax=Achromobacter ruhlandii TaxID=72557 RepID=UPI003015BE17
MNSKTKSGVKQPKARVGISKPDELALCAQVDGACPLCGAPLFLRKGGRNYRQFEIAHIYPLNPTAQEEALLLGEARLFSDVNDAENLIPLCFSCHAIYDNGKTIEKYRELVEIKRALLMGDEQKRIFLQYEIERELNEIIDSLCDVAAYFPADDSFEAKRVDAKLDQSVRPLTKRKIKSDVAAFYIFVRDRFSDLERLDPNKAVLIAHQVKSFYLKQKALGLPQQQIYENAVKWIQSKRPAASQEASGVIAAFFVQNCELFE